MIWYEIPFLATRAFFVVLLMTACLQIIVALKAVEILREKHTLWFVRLLYSLLALISAAFSMEALIAIASVEGGVYLPVTPGFRYAAALPVLLLPYAIKTRERLPFPLRQCVVNCFIPLLLLLPEDLLPARLSFFVTAFVTVWLASDAVRMLLSLRAYSRQEVPRDVIAHIIRNIDHGVCIANRRGYILEANPAFYSLCARLGVSRFEKINEINEALRKLQWAGQLEITELADGRSIRTEDNVYFLRQNAFLSNGKLHEELALSDVTQAARAATELERENRMLEQENGRLRQAIAGIELEAASLEREKLGRTAHDVWSQRLAVAGLSLDVLLDQTVTERGAGNAEAFPNILDAPETEDFAQVPRDLTEALEILAGTYRKLGVRVRLHGEAVFAVHEREALYGVLREALANAVRHAYARSIDVHFFEDTETRGIIVQNACLDDNPTIHEGRGLHDIKARVHSAGGAVIYGKSDVFELRVTFPRDPVCS